MKITPTIQRFLVDSWGFDEEFAEKMALAISSAIEKAHEYEPESSDEDVYAIALQAFLENA